MSTTLNSNKAVVRPSQLLSKIEYVSLMSLQLPYKIVNGGKSKTLNGDENIWNEKKEQRCYIFKAYVRAKESSTLTDSLWLQSKKKKKNELKKMAWVRVNACSAVCIWVFNQKSTEQKRIYCMPKSDAKEAVAMGMTLFHSLPNLPSLFSKTIKISEKWWSLINDMQSNALGRNDTGIRYCVYVLFLVSSPYIHILWPQKLSLHCIVFQCFSHSNPIIYWCVWNHILSSSFFLSPILFILIFHITKRKVTKILQVVKWKMNILEWKCQKRNRTRKKKCKK